jgi:hypothetical protein
MRRRNIDVHHVGHHPDGGVDNHRLDHGWDDDGPAADDATRNDHDHGAPDHNGRVVSPRRRSERVQAVRLT